MPEVVVAIIVTILIVAAVVAANEISQEQHDQMALNDFIKADFEPFKSFVNSTFDDLRARVAALEAAVYGHLQPVVSVLRDGVNTAHTLANLANGRIDALVNDLYGKVFPGLDDLRATLRKNSHDLQEIVGVFDAKLSHRLGDLEGKLLGRLDSVTKDLRDELLSRIHEATDPIQRKVMEITSTVERVNGLLTGRLDLLTGRMDGVFGPTGELTDRALHANISKWGRELLEGTILKTEPAATGADRIAVQRQGGEGVTEFFACVFYRGGFWDDLDKYQNEHLEEIYHGRPRITAAELLVNDRSPAWLPVMSDAELDRCVHSPRSPLIESDAARRQRQPADAPLPVPPVLPGPLPVPPVLPGPLPGGLL